MRVLFYTAHFPLLTGLCSKSVFYLTSFFIALLAFCSVQYFVLMRWDTGSITTVIFMTTDRYRVSFQLHESAFILMILVERNSI